MSSTVFEAVSQTITRPNDTTAYASGDLVANSVTAGSVTPFAITLPFDSKIKLWRVGVSKSAASATNATWRVHLYKDSPTAANGDNGAWSTTRSGYLGPVDVAGSTQAFTDAAIGWGVYVNNAVQSPLVFDADADRIVYALLEARAAYTPAAQETFFITLVGEAGN